MVVLGDEPVVERAPIVDLWIKAARRRGADVVTVGCAGSVQRAPGQSADACQSIANPGDELGDRLRASERAVLIWSGSGGHGGATLAALAHELGFADKPGCTAFHLPATPNGRGVAEAWAAAAETESPNPQPLRLLIVSGDEAAADPNVRALAEHADAVLAITMFQGLAVGWADLVLPATSYLERDGTFVNLEGRLQRLRRAVIPPGPDELAWVAKLAERFGVELSPHPSQVFDELAVEAYGGTTFASIGEHAELPRADGGAPGRGAADPGAGNRGRWAATARSLPRPLLRPRCRARAGARLPSPACGARAGDCGRRSPRHRRRATRSGSARTARRVELRAVVNRAHESRSRARGRRARTRPEERRRSLQGTGKPERSGGFAVSGAVVDLDHQGDPDREPGHGRVRVHDVGRAQADRADAAPLRAEPRGAVRAAAADRRPGEADP